MTPDEIRTLTSRGETMTVEFKRATAGSLNQDDIVEFVVCMANGEGGHILLGVEDDGAITGAVDPKGEPIDPSSLSAMILNKTQPPISATVESVDVDDKQVVVIAVPEAPTPAGTKGGLYKRRTIDMHGRPECVPFFAHEIVSAGMSMSGRDYAEVPARGATPADSLAPEEFEKFRRLCRTGKGDADLAEGRDEDILRALRVVHPVTGDITLGALLLFGTEAALATHVPTAEVLFQEESGRTLTANENLRAPLFRTIEWLRERLDARSSEQELQIGLQRVAVPRLPDRTVREVIANALVHRDYSELGPIRVALSPDRLYVSSPGGLPPGINLANMLDESRPRSVILADAFKRAGLVDRNGRGVRDVYFDLLRIGRRGPDYSATTAHSVSVSVPTSDADLELARFVFEYEQSQARPLALRHLQLLHELKAMHDSTAAELENTLNVAAAQLREDLARLGEMGLVEPRGHGRGRRYQLTSAFYRAADANAYARLQDTDPFRQEEMILSFVEKFGSITRGKAADLCRLTPPQARTVLKRLTDRGALKLIGERRGARYERP